MAESTSPKVVHCKRAPQGSYVYIGRPTIFGNPIRLNDPTDDRERDQVLAATPSTSRRGSPATPRSGARWSRFEVVTLAAGVPRGAATARSSLPGSLPTPTPMAGATHEPALR